MESIVAGKDGVKDRLVKSEVVESRGSDTEGNEKIVVETFAVDDILVIVGADEVVEEFEKDIEELGQNAEKDWTNVVKGDDEDEGVDSISTGDDTGDDGDDDSEDDSTRAVDDIGDDDVGVDSIRAGDESGDDDSDVVPVSVVGDRLLVEMFDKRDVI
jgi:hypothetical protein